MSLHLLDHAATLNVSEGATPPIVTVPAAGPLRLYVLVPPTADKCGARVDLRLTRPQANQVRRGAALVGMDVPAFVVACLGENLPTRSVPAMGHSLKTLVLDPAVRRRIQKLAGYYGHKRQETYVHQLLESELWSDEREMIVDPRTGQAVGTERFWRKLRTLLLKHTQRTVDPLEHPGFVAHYEELERTLPTSAENRLPFAEEEFRACPDWSLARIAA